MRGKQYAETLAITGAEEPLVPYGACLLGSINLSAFVKNKFKDNSYFDFESFKETVRESVIALNDVLDEGIALHPLEQQKETARNLRQIGLGIMGYGDMLIKLGKTYGKLEALDITEKIGRCFINTALQQSALLAKYYGAFPSYNEEYVLSSPWLQSVADDDTMKLIKKHGLRNSQILTSAPTGSLSSLIGVSGGIEPIYQISYTRKTETLNEGDTYYRVFTPIAREYMEMNSISNESDLPDFFVTAMTLDWKDRVKTQAVWQKYIDASISSTVNLPENATVEDVKQLYIYAWKSGLKGITIFRDNCARIGVLSKDGGKTKDTKDMSIDELQDLIAEKANKKYAEDPTSCPMCKTTMIQSGGCSECLECGYSPCGV